MSSLADRMRDQTGRIEAFQKEGPKAVINGWAAEVELMHRELLLIEEENQKLIARLKEREDYVR